MWQQRLLSPLTLTPMSIHFASALTSLSQGLPEDGTVAGQGLSPIQTFMYFFATPILLFIAISVIVYALTADRKKTPEPSSILTNIE